MRTVTLYGKPDCHLCDAARAVIDRVARELPLQLVELDITADERLHRAYFERIPVVAIDGRERFEFFVDEAALRALLSPEADHLESGQ